MQKSADINDHIKKQKLHYKDGAKSICKKCTRYENDCFDAMKVCGKDEKSGYSTVEKYGNYKEKSVITTDRK